MTLLDVEELTRYWIDHPPLHLMVAAYLGIGKEDAGRVRSKAHSRVRSGVGAHTDADALLAEFGPSFTSRDVHAGLPPVLLDFAELKRRINPPD
jgi:hypothetical protein